MGNVPPIGRPSGENEPAAKSGGGQSGEPHYEIRHSDKGIIKGPYFVLINSAGVVVHESNVYLGGEEEEHERFCEDGAIRELKSWIKLKKIT